MVDKSVIASVIENVGLKYLVFLFKYTKDIRVYVRSGM